MAINKIILVQITALGLLFSQSSILETEHNLSIYGVGEIKSVTEEQVCIFCHASHGTDQTVLWNRTEGSTNYTLYGSPTMDSHTLPPGSHSRLCLSCHDGTVALGLVRNRPYPIEFPVGMDKIPPGYRTNLSENLGDDHPITLDFNPHPTGELVCTGCHSLHSGTNSNLECTSCHDPHSNVYGNFLVADPISGGICNQCHLMTGWDLSLHSTSTNTWNSTGPDPWPYTEWTSVSENACNNCHDPHGVNSSFWLLKHSSEEENCYVCHNGNVADLDIEAEMAKISSHPVGNFQDIHAPNEIPEFMDDHVECSDCHNPHQVTAGTAAAPYIQGSQTGVSGINENAVYVPGAQFEYEICFKCHQTTDVGTQFYVDRYDEQLSILQEFSTSNPSFHPVVSAGVNSNVPSLIAPFTVNSIIYCTDCHNNDQVDTQGGVNGPHGSIYAPILVEQMVFTDYNNESASIYALCYRCHDRNSILSDTSFEEHNTHIVEERASCTTCHDPHGSYNNGKLINFNTDYVTPSMPQGLIQFNSDDTGGECYLRCHGKNHRPKRYGSW